MADETVIIDVTPDPQPEHTSGEAASDATTGTTNQNTTPKAKKSRAPLLLVLIFIAGAFGAGIYWSQELAARLGVTLPGAQANGQITALQNEIAQIAQDLAVSRRDGAAERDGLEARIALLETSPAGIGLSPSEAGDPAIASRLDALAEQDELLSKQLDQIHADIEAGIARTDNSAIQVQVETQASQQQNLADRTRALEEGFAQQTGQLDTMTEGSLQGLEEGLMALAVSRLRQAVDGGGAYIDERKAVEELVARRERISFEAVDALRELAIFEAEGVPTIAALQLDFQAITTQMPSDTTLTAVSDAEAAWWEQLWQSLTEGITVRRTDEPLSLEGDDPLTLIGSALDRHDLVAVLDGVAVADAGIQARLSDWTDRVQERLRANLALDVLMASTGAASQ